MPAAVALDLPLPGDGAAGGAEGGQRVGALEVEVHGQLGAQPVGQRRGQAWRDVELAHQRRWPRRPHGGGLRQHAVVEQPLTGVVVFEPGGDGGVVPVVHQQGAGEAADTVSKYLIERAEQYQPVVEMPTGIAVEIVFLDGVHVRSTSQ